MTYTEEYWNPIKERYSLVENHDLHDLINNIAYPFDKTKLKEYHENVSETDQNKDREIIELLIDLRKLCKDADADARKYTPRIRNSFVKLMKLMDERGWKNLPNNQSTQVFQQRRVGK